MSKINIKELETIAYNLKLKPTKEVLEGLKRDSQRIENNLNKLKAINITNVEPMFRIDETPTSFLREDEAGQTLTTEQVLKNSKSKQGNFITITKVVK